MSLGTGQWTCYLTERGGGAPILELPFSNLTTSRVLDNSAAWTITIPAGQHKTVRKVARPWEHEVVAYRNNDVAFLGPFVKPQGNQLQGQDLFYWMEKRFIEHDLHFFGDLTQAFIGVMNKALEPDDSPNITVVHHDSGVDGLRTYKGKDFHRAADLLREMARTALDFTTIGRTVYVGGKEVFAPTSAPAQPLVLHDGGVVNATVNRDGDKFATDVAVFAGHSGPGENPRPVALTGRATREVGLAGLVQAVFTELLIKDLESADENALSKLEAMQPAPLSVHAQLSPDAAFTFEELIPGRRFDVRLSDEVADEEVVGPMRLNQASIEISETGENISIDLVPIGVISEE